jgi:hypothetical protein
MAGKEMEKALKYLGLLGILFLVMYVYQCEHSSQLQDALVSQQDSAKFWRDEAGRSNAEKTTVELQLRDAKKVQGELLDKIKTQTGIKPRNVETVVTVTTHTRDTIHLNWGRYEDEWAVFDLLDSTTLAYSIRDSITLIHHRDHYGFLGLKTKDKVRAISFNPRSTITGLTSLEIEPPKRRFSVGPYVGYGLTTSGGVVRTGVQVGVGITFRIF